MTLRFLAPAETSDEDGGANHPEARVPAASPLRPRPTSTGSPVLASRRWQFLPPIDGDDSPGSAATTAESPDGVPHTPDTAVRALPSDDRLDIPPCLKRGDPACVLGRTT